MAAESLPAVVYLKGGQITLANFHVKENSLGFEEDAETKYKPDGTFQAKITYSRRLTISATCEALDGATPGNVQSYMGGELVATFHGVTKWKIRNATANLTRGAQVLTLDLIALSDEIPV